MVIPRAFKPQDVFGFCGKPLGFPSYIGPILPKDATWCKSEMKPSNAMRRGIGSKYDYNYATQPNGTRLRHGKV